MQKVSRDAGNNALRNTGKCSGDGHDDDDYPGARRPPKYTDSARELVDDSGAVIAHPGIYSANGEKRPSSKHAKYDNGHQDSGRPGEP
jgi:hypothetical protein